MYGDISWYLMTMYNFYLSVTNKIKQELGEVATGVGFSLQGKER